MNILSNGIFDRSWQWLHTHVVYAFTQVDADAAFSNGSGLGLGAGNALSTFFFALFLTLIYIGSAWVILSELYNWGAKGSGFGELMMVVVRAAVLPLVATIFANFF